jgi:hypothetical protein
MQAMGLQGVIRGKPVRTTISDKGIPPVWAALPLSAGITDASMFD